MEYRLCTPLTAEKLQKLHIGDKVLLSGTVYTARDATHARLCVAIAAGEALPFELADACIFYAGPCPAPTDRPIGSVGPTTSYRMDSFAPILLKHGLKAMIGKGDRSEEVRLCCIEQGACYFAACGGIAALLAQCVKSAEIIAYDDLGTEAIRRLQIEKLPLIVAIDASGADIYHENACKA